MSKSPQDILTLLAITGAASSGQLGHWIGLAGNVLHGLLSKLAAGNLITCQGRVRLTPKGRPQLVWSLAPLGARRAGLYFPPSLGRDGLFKGLLKTHFVIAHPDGYYPLYFQDQLALFEKQGAKWPWRNKEEPTRVSALIRLKEDEVHVALALGSPREARQLLEPSLLLWLKRPGYRLSLLIAEEQLEVIQKLLDPQIANWQDPYSQQKKTYREWKALLKCLPAEQEHYRPHIERVLKWAEMENAQESAGRYDLILRAFSQVGYKPDLHTLSITSFKLLESEAVKS